MSLNRTIRRKINHCRFSVCQRKCVKRFFIVTILFSVGIMVYFRDSTTTPENGGYSNRKETVETEFPYPYKNFINILSGFNVTLIVLDPNVLFNKLSTATHKLISFGVFQSDLDGLSPSDLQEKLYIDKWVYVVAMKQDTRFLNKRKELSEWTHEQSHIFYSFEEEYVVHLAIIFPRSDYLMIFGYDDNTLGSRLRHLKRLNFAIPLPMALEPFQCNWRQMNKSNFCFPQDESHYLWQLQYAKFIECDYENTVWKFNEQFETQQFDNSPYQDTLNDIMKLFRNRRIPLLTFYGTLLGWYRQCDFIVHSIDLDFAIYRSNFSENLFSSIWESDSFLILERFGNLEAGLELGLFSKYGVMVDVYLMYEFDNTVSLFSMSDKTQLKQTFTKFDRICSADLLDVLVYIPCDAKSLITEEYGVDGWFAPNMAPDRKNLEQLETIADDLTFEKFHHVYKSRNCTTPSLNFGCD